MTEVIKEDNPESPQIVSSILKREGIIIYPTETLYGMGAIASNEESVSKIFEVKGRPHGKPIPILVRDRDMLAEFAEITEQASKLIDAFLPGPLTLILKEKKNLPVLITAGTGKVAVRISRHPFVKRLFNLVSEPITSTSANISAGENLFSFDEIYRVFKDKVDLIIDSGNLPPSKGSTVVDLTVEPPVVVREGDISKEELKEFINIQPRMDTD
ncbi:MAG TPA: L-threonylcarbamoyladenylate synthase [Thermodesulfobacteriota bacterium]|nr:L-threonylcarbamoyladenylate synthase [Thermodesulfobacteriota bacterium]